MKRGLITWDKAELPPEAFEARLDTARTRLAERDLPAMVVFSDVWRSNQGRHFSNFMPYWNRALIVLPREGAPVLLCALSPRVYPWIRSVTILDEIRPSGNLTQKLFEMCSEKGWQRVGVLDLSLLPNDLYAPMHAAEIEIAEIPGRTVWPTPDRWEISMHRRAAGLARQVLAEEFPKAAGCVDHEFAGLLERAFRRAGAEDLVILLTNGQTPPLPPRGAKLGEDCSIAIALEYRGHWIKLSRPHPSSNAAAPLQSRFKSSLKNLASGEDTPVYVENLSGPYPYESCQPADVGPGSLFALHIESHSNGNRLFYGDTCSHGPGGAELL